VRPTHGNACCGGAWCTCEAHCGAEGCWGRRPAIVPEASEELILLRKRGDEHAAEIAASFRRS
jgi:hypothetical protein